MLVQLTMPRLSLATFTMTAALSYAVQIDATPAGGECSGYTPEGRYTGVYTDSSGARHESWIECYIADEALNDPNSLCQRRGIAVVNTVLGDIYSSRQECEDEARPAWQADMVPDMSLF